MAESHVFEVEMPDGSILEIDAPATTSPDAIRQRARQHWNQSKTMQPPGIPKPPVPRELQPRDYRGTQMLTMNALDPMSHADAFIGVAKSLGNTFGFGGQPTNPQQSVGYGVGNAAQYAIPAALTGGASIPTQIGVNALSSALVARGAGQDPVVAGVLGGAGAATPAIIGGLSRALSLPEKLMTGAASARASVAKVQPHVPTTKTDALAQAIKASVRPVVNTGARMAEGLSRQLAQFDNAPTAPPTREPAFQGTPFEPPTLPQRMGYTPPQNVPPVEPMRGAFPGEVQQQVGVTRPPARYEAPLDEPPVWDMRAPARPPQPIQMADQPNFAAIQPKGQALGAPEINKWMNVQPRQMVHGANPAQQILDDGLLAATKEATLANVDNALTQVGEQMQSVLNQASQRGVRMNVEQQVMDALSDATKTIGRRTDSAFQNSLTGILDDILSRYPDLRQMSPSQAHALKVEIGDAVKWGRGAAYEADLNQVLVDIYRKLNQGIKASVPELGGLQTRWGNLYQGSKALKGSLTKDAVGRGTGAVPQPPKTPAPNMAQQLSQELERMK